MNGSEPSAASSFSAGAAQVTQGQRGVVSAKDAAQPTPCQWGVMDELYQRYHDECWGKPLHDERRLFELLCLECQQAGLSWSLILHRADGLRRVYDGFDPEKLATWTDAQLEAARQDPAAIRNRLKIKAMRTNAQAYAELARECGGLDAYLWEWVDGQPIVNHPLTMADIPAQSELSRTISRDLRKRGFTFVGPVVVYSYLQAAGLINDHLEHCPAKYAAAGSR